MKIRELRAQRTKLGAEAAAIMDEAQTAGRSMTPEEETKFDNLLNERDKVDATIERAERLRDDDRRAAGDEPGDPAGPGTRDGDEAMGALRAYFLGGRAALSERQARALNAGNDPEGGFLVAPEQFVQKLLQNIDDAMPLRGLATVQRLTMAESLGIPTLDTDLADATWTSEIGTGSQDDALRFGKRELRPHPLAKRVKVSRKLLRASSMGPEAIVRERMAYRHATAQEAAFMTGDGNQKPLGLFTASADGISTSRDVNISTDATALVNVTAGNAGDDLITAKYTLKPQYWPKAKWLFHRNVIRDIRKLKDSDGQYLWMPGLAGDRPDTIIDVPFIVSEFAPSAFTDDAYLGMIGDFSFYWIVDALNFEIQRLVELYAETNQVGFIGRAEVDAMPVLEEPFVRLQSDDVSGS
jgi:HK97 family phage major capsid protein